MVDNTYHTLDFVTLDVFTASPYLGNPLAVVKIPTNLKSAISKEQQLKIATEFNFSETVFLHQRADINELKWNIDIFSTTEELPFAGHPTIGSAFYALTKVQKEHGEKVRNATLITKAGEIPLETTIEAGNHGLTVHARVPHNVRIHAQTFARLGTQPSWLSPDEKIRELERNAPFVSIVKGMTFMLIQLETLEDLALMNIQHEDLQLDRMLDSEDGWSRSFVGRYYYVLLDKVGGRQNIRTRMLERGMEDPATGSAASALASYLGLHGPDKKFEIVQGFEMGRKSIIGVEVELSDDGKSCKTVKLSGTAVQIMEGTIMI